MLYKIVISEPNGKIIKEEVISGYKKSRAFASGNSGCIAKLYREGKLLHQYIPRKKRTKKAS